MTSAPTAVAVVIPARDESETIESCLRSVTVATEAAGIETWIVVVADRCRDDTAERARRAIGARGEVRVVGRGNVGAARRAGCRRALLHFRDVPPERLWLMSTDADSTVPADWIVAHCAQAARGAVAVAGTIRVASFAERPRFPTSRFEQHYAATRVTSQPHLHATNFGVRADAYAMVGGWPALDTGEDHALWAGLAALGLPLAVTSRAPVVTSGRRDGRAPDGFAAYLDAFEAVASPVPS